MRVGKWDGQWLAYLVGTQDGDIVVQLEVPRRMTYGCKMLGG